MKQEILIKMQDLAKKYYKIQTMNWIQSKGDGFGGAGITLEYLLGKLADNDILPDYHGIELKTTQINSKYNTPIGLFSMALDNQPLQMQYLYETYGWPSKNDSNQKVFYAKINADYSRCTRRCSFKLYVNYEKECVELRIYDHYNKERIKKELSWSFYHLKLRLETKLTYLCVAEVLKYYRTHNESYYYKFQEISFYELKSFEKFLELIEDGTINVHIKITSRQKGEQWEMYDKGTTFEIYKEDIEKLFTKLSVSIKK